MTSAIPQVAASTRLKSRPFDSPVSARLRSPTLVILCLVISASFPFASSDDALPPIFHQSEGSIRYGEILIETVNSEGEEKNLFSDKK